MKAFSIALLAAVGFLVAMIVVDVFAHDQTLYEAWKGSPDQFWQSLGSLVLLAWQYKIVTVIAFGLAIAVLFVRGVPDLRNR